MCYTVLVVLKIMYGGKIMNLITSSFCRAVARHSAPRARLGDAESTKLSTRRGFSSDGTLPRSQSRAEYDHCSEEGTLILGVESAARDPPGAPECAAKRINGPRVLWKALFTT